MDKLVSAVVIFMACVIVYVGYLVLSPVVNMAAGMMQALPH